MAEISFLRYASSFIAIVCCLILPLTVEWILSPVNHLNHTYFHLNANQKNITLDLQPISFYYFEIYVLLFHIAILACSSFVQLYFYFKLLMMFIGISIYLVGFQMQKSYQLLANSMHTTHLFLFGELLIQLVFFVLFLHLIDRRIEMNSRLDFLWRNKFKKENDELQVTSDLSRLLIENMLPKHVVEIIMDPQRNIDVCFKYFFRLLDLFYLFFLFKEVYHEKYDCVAVMFASIPK